jgi:hypothetical protein
MLFYTYFLSIIYNPLKDIMQTAINKMGGSVELDQPDWGVEEIPALPDENEYWKK